MNVSRTSLSFWVCFLGALVHLSGCSGSSNPKTTPQEVGLPTANNFRQVPATDFFFVLDLEVVGSITLLKHANASIAKGDVEKIAQLYQDRKDQEGGHADVVIAAKEDVPSNEVLDLVSDLRKIGILQINFRVDSPEESGRIPGSALGLMVHQFPSLDDSAALTNLPDSSQLVVSVLSESLVAVDRDTFSTNALGGHLKRIHNNATDPQLRVLLSATDIPFGGLISAFDQVIISGFRQYEILSQDEMKRLVPGE